MIQKLGGRPEGVGDQGVDYVIGLRGLQYKLVGMYNNISGHSLKQYLEDEYYFVIRMALETS